MMYTSLRFSYWETEETTTNVGELEQALHRENFEHENKYSRMKVKKKE